jgi:hypothetical protein
MLFLPKAAIAVPATAIEERNFFRFMTLKLFENSHFGIGTDCGIFASLLCRKNYRDTVIFPVQVVET